jgi:Tfp pilus assembly protein PilW
MIARLANERGLTLTEVMVVGVLGTLVMIGLVGFYMQSQATWLDASSQVITQREGTMVAQAIADSARACGSVVVTPSPDADRSLLQLVRNGATTAHYQFWWNSADSLVHQGTSPTTGRPMLTSKVERFAVTSDSRMVRVELRLRSPQGQQVEASASAALMNR